MTIKDLIAHYQKLGNDRFYRSLLASAIDTLIRIESGLDATSPEIELLDSAEQCLRLYRKEGLESYLDLSRCLRKAGHKIYRLMLKKALTNRNPKFLQAV